MTPAAEMRRPQPVMPANRLGDLAGRPDVARHFINRAVGMTLDARAQARINPGNGQDANAPSLVRHPELVRKRLEAQVADLRAYVDMKYGGENGVLSQIEAKYKAADEASKGKGYGERMAARFGQFEDVIVVSDFDGTITKDPDSYLEHIPASVHAEPLLKQHPLKRHGFGDVFAQTWQPVLEHAPEAFQATDAPVEITEGAADFFKMTQEKGIKTRVLSANFKPFVEHHLGKIEGTEGVEVDAITHDSIVSSAKDAMLKLIAAQNPNSAIVYLGDGSSDEDAVAARGVVALYGAREGLGFHKQLAVQEQPVDHFPYRNFHDVKQVVELAHSLTQKEPQQAA